MGLYPMGEYYAWFCGWCDSENMTLWTMADQGELSCGACHRRTSIADLLDAEQDDHLAVAC